MRVVVCGSRDFIDPFTVSIAIDRRMSELPEGSHVIHGDARGADRIAAEAAERRGHTVEAFPADWKKYGKAAGIFRSRRMLDQKPDLVIAYWNGKSTGTAYTIAEARTRGIPVEVVVA